MSVTRHRNGKTVIVTLGGGDTMIGAASQRGAEFPDCIILTNRPAEKGEYKLRGDEVIIQFTNVRGVLSMHLALADMLSQWPLDGLERQWGAWAKELEMLVDSIPTETEDGDETAGEEGKD